MKKEIIITRIAVHPTQAAIIMACKDGSINFKENSLREIAKIIKGKESPQAIKHHLEQLVKMGVLDYIKGEYSYSS